MNLDKLTKKQSGVIFLIVYAFTMAGGTLIIVLGNRLDMLPIWSMLLADVVMTIIIFIVGSIIKNASLYDPYWSVIPLYAVIVWIIDFYLFALPFNIIILLIVIAFWSIRLTYNWWKNWDGFSHQDWRYDLLRDKNPKLYPLTNLMGIHMIPTLVVFIQLICVYLIMQYTTVNFLFFIGALISLSGPVIQFISDKQMYDFRAEKNKTSKVINSGLWRFSRHPNYFGELIFWIGIYIMYFSYSKAVDIHVIYPVLMIMLFVFISIPMMENKLKHRDGYDEYKKTVSMIIPFFPKKQKNKEEIVEENS